MWSMALGRMMVAVPSLAGVVIVTFLLTRALPGDPAAYFAGPAATKDAIEQIRSKLGLDQPLPVQFVRYVADLPCRSASSLPRPRARSSTIAAAS
jgi:dipeptide transport system permease protein